MEKRGQIAIFIIVALVIVVAAVLAYLLFPNIRTAITGEVIPNSYLADCMEPSIENGIATLSKQGGYAAPSGYILYKGVQIKYLCYSSQYYTTCQVQQPLIKKQFEDELSGILDARAEECTEQLKNEYERRGYDVNSRGNVKSSVEIIPNIMGIRIEAPIQISKDGSVQTFGEFNFERNSKMYEILMISHSIIDYESTYGDSATDLYMAYYPNILIEKTKLTGGSTIYKVSDVTTEESFMFASRSLAWPAGYGFEK